MGFMYIDIFLNSGTILAISCSLTLWWGRVGGEVEFFFSCDSSSISCNVGRSVRLSVGRSASNEFYRSVMILVVFICCYNYCSLDYQIILWLYFAFFSCNSSSICHNVSLQVCLSATSFMEVLCCG